MSTLAAVRSPFAYRAADYFDIPALVRLLRQFAQTTKYREFIGPDEAHLATLLEGLVANPHAALFVATRDVTIVGVIGVLGYAHPMSGQTVAGELFWWLDPNHRGAGGWLLRRAEKWAKAYGARSLQMIAPAESPHVGLMYERLGYAPVETSYQRIL